MEIYKILLFLFSAEDSFYIFVDPDPDPVSALEKNGSRSGPKPNPCPEDEYNTYWRTHFQA